MISVTDQSNNLTYRNLANANNTLVPNYALRQAVSYVTGAHAIKFGVNETFGFIDTTSYTPSALPVAYRFNTINGGPRRTRSRSGRGRSRRTLTRTWTSARSCRTSGPSNVSR
jgi:hypothetical protein